VKREAEEGLGVDGPSEERDIQAGDLGAHSLPWRRRGIFRDPSPVQQSERMKSEWFLEDRCAVGRMYEDKHARPELQWFWWGRHVLERPNVGQQNRKTTATEVRICR
jgi:hypothetical protein